jgi:hypothetical protein
MAALVIELQKNNNRLQKANLHVDVPTLWLIDGHQKGAVA